MHCKKAQDIPSLQGYSYPPFYNMRGDGSIQVATYIKPNIPVTPIMINFPDYVKATSIEVVSQNKKLKIINMYLPEGDRTGSWVDAVPDREDCVVLGDFNTRSSLWEDDCPPCYECPGVRDKVTNSNLVVLNDGSMTRIPDRHQNRPSAIDLSFVSASLAGSCDWSTGGDPLGSDHIPITVVLGTDIVRDAREDGGGAYNYKKADWGTFRSALGAEQPLDVSGLSIDGHAAALTKTILSAADQNIPRNRKNKSSNKNNPWWNTSCKQAVRKKQKTFSIYRKNRSQINHENMVAAKIECKKTIAEAKLSH